MSVRICTAAGISSCTSRTADASLSAFFESLDIWQSVLARFFKHLDTGKLDLDEPIQLKKRSMPMNGSVAPMRSADAWPARWIGSPTNLVFAKGNMPEFDTAEDEEYIVDLIYAE